MKLRKISAVILACSLLLTGCSNSNTQEKKGTTSVDQSVSADYPMTIKHALGETVIESRPEKIATIGWGNQDVPLALGVVPVGASKANYGEKDENGLLPWTGAKYKELGIDKPLVYDDIDGLDYEAISDSKPDVILASYSGITQEEYDLLSQIAPVVAYTGAAYQTYWREQITLNALGMGMKDEGDQLVSDLEKLIEEKTADYSQLKGKKAVFTYFDASDLGKFYVYLPTDPRAAYLTDLGLEFPDSVKELAKETDSFALELSSENIDKLSDVDVIVCYGDESLLKQMQADPLLGTLPAIKRGSVALLEDESALAASSTPSALSIPAAIDEYLKLLGEAADRV
ncbi:MAG: iron-siderophore ABC transporter substrate-binding protein [Clostridium sp.]|nr:iron-siderophore ABC transporter substrate-binding protein [Clostridium sp.]